MQSILCQQHDTFSYSAVTSVTGIRKHMEVGGRHMQGAPSRHMQGATEPTATGRAAVQHMQWAAWMAKVAGAASWAATVTVFEYLIC